MQRLRSLALSTPRFRRAGALSAFRMPRFFVPFAEGARGKSGGAAIRILSVIAVTAAATAAGCALLPESGAGPPLVEATYLTGHWVHSVEEEPVNSTVHVYRPADSREFPPSRFRMQYVFEAGGDLQWYYLAPNDGHHFRTGRWHLDADEHATLTLEQGNETRIYRIVELHEDVLRMSPVVPGGE